MHCSAYCLEESSWNFKQNLHKSPEASFGVSFLIRVFQIIFIGSGILSKTSTGPHPVG